MSEREGKKYFRVYHGLLTPKHTKAMGPALRVFLWCIMRIFKEVRRGRGWIGLVWNGKPVLPQTIADQLGLARTTVIDHLKHLGIKPTPDKPYLELSWTSRGVTIIVPNSKKWRRTDGQPSVDEPPSVTEAPSVGNPTVSDGQPTVSVGNPSPTNRKLKRKVKERERKRLEDVAPPPSDYELEILKIFQEIPRFRRDETKNLNLIRVLEAKHSDVDQRLTAADLRDKIVTGAYKSGNLVNSYHTFVGMDFKFERNKKRAPGEQTEAEYQAWRKEVGAH